MKKPTRVAWGLSAILLVLVAAASWRLAVRLRPYWVAKYRGRGAALHAALLIDAPLAGADLTWVHLADANLRHANLAGASLRAASLSSARLQGANLCGADLTHTFFDGANLAGATFTGANLTQTRFADANLRSADLRGTDLHGADLLGQWPAHLTGARYDRRTRWPAGFDPAKHGAIRADRG